METEVMMNMYEISFTYNIKEYGEIQLPAPNKEVAEEDALEYIKETYPDVTDIEVTSVEEIV